MGALHRRIRGGPIALVALVVLTTLPAIAAQPPTAHRYSISGSLQSTPLALTGGGYSAQTSLIKTSSEPVVQQDARYSLTSRLAAVSTTCGNDLIFMNGFENPPVG